MLCIFCNCIPLLFVPEIKQDLWQLQPIKHVYKTEMNGRFVKVHGWLSFALWLRGVQNVNEKVDLKHSGSAVQGRHRRMKNAWSSVCTSNFTHRNSTPIPTGQQARISIVLAIWVVVSEQVTIEQLSGGSESMLWPFRASYSAVNSGKHITYCGNGDWRVFTKECSLTLGFMWRIKHLSVGSP